MARLYQSGFELNSIAANVEWSSTSTAQATIQTSTVRTGVYAGQSAPSASSTAYFQLNVFTANQTTVGSQRIYMSWSSFPSATSEILNFGNTTSTRQSAIAITSSGQLQLLKADGTQLGSNSATLNTGVFYRIELKNDATTSPGTIEGLIDGVSFASGTNSAQGSWARIRVGQITAVTTGGVVYLDDYALNDSTGSFQTGYPGSGKIVHVRPNAAGDANSFAVQVGGTAGSTNNFTRVNEVTPNDATSYNASSVLNQEDLFGVGLSGAQPNDTVNVVMVGARFADITSVDVTTSIKLEIEKTSGGTISQSASIDPDSTTWVTNNNSTRPAPYPLVLYQDPDNINWTNITLGTMQIGYKLTTANVQAVGVSTLWASIDYTPSAPLVSYQPTKIANRNVGPMALRYSFRQPVYISQLSYPVLNLTKTQTAKADISTVATKIQHAIARITLNKTKTQTTIARVAINSTKTQAATASIHVDQVTAPTVRIANRNTGPMALRYIFRQPYFQPQPFISASQTKTQTAVARIAQNYTLTQSAIARISQNYTTTQSAKAHISPVVTKTQSGIAKIATNLTKTQSALSRVANNFTKTQTGISRLANNVTKTQSAVAQINQGNTKTQTGKARIQQTVTKTQGAVGRIATNLTLTQSAIARIATGLTKTQTSIARIQQTITKTQSATARIQQMVAKTQGAIARLANNATKTQGAIAKITKSLTLTQGAIARIVRQSTKTQTGKARVTIIKTKIQTGKAHIKTIVSSTQSATARVGVVLVIGNADELDIITPVNGSTIAGSNNTDTDERITAISGSTQSSQADSGIITAIGGTVISATISTDDTENITNVTGISVTGSSDALDIINPASGSPTAGHGDSLDNI